MRLRVMAQVGGAIMMCGMAGAQSRVILEDAPPPPMPPSVMLGGVVAAYSMQPVTGLPYSMVQRTTTVKTLGDGTKITTVREEHKMRDSQGRERTESGLMKDGTMKVMSVYLRDPVTRTTATLFPTSHMAIVNHIAEPQPAPPLTPEQKAKIEEMRAKFEASRKEHPQARNNVEKLQGQMMDGVYVEGVRTSMVIAAGKEGNDRDIHVADERWTSPDLKVTIATTLDDPRMGKIAMETSQLSRVEPDPTLFEIPADYKIQDQKR